MKGLGIMSIERFHVIHELARIDLHYGGIKQKHLEIRAKQLNITPENLMIAVKRYIKKHNGFI